MEKKIKTITKIYHGTIMIHYLNIEEEGIKILINPHRTVDFGYGFYTTSNFEQAKRWAKSISRATDTKINKDKRKAVVVEYSINIEYIEKLKYKIFNTYCQDWKEFVHNNKIIDYQINNNHNLDLKYDLVFGYMADNKLGNILRELVEIREKIDSLDYRKLIEKIEPHDKSGEEDQMSFHSIEAIELLKFEKIHIV